MTEKMGMFHGKSKPTKALARELFAAWSKDKIHEFHSEAVKKMVLGTVNDTALSFNRAMRLGTDSDAFSYMHHPVAISMTRELLSILQDNGWTQDMLLALLAEYMPTTKEPRLLRVRELARQHRFMLMLRKVNSILNLAKKDAA